MISTGRNHHVGIRVSDAERASAFYRQFGFKETYRDTTEPMLVLTNGRSAEIKLVANAGARAGGPNVMMDEPEKYPGYTRVALEIGSVERARAELTAAGIAISGGPVELGGGISLFVRDPDRNIIELRQSREAPAWSLA